MQQCQDHLEFNIETPSDEELERRHAAHEEVLAQQIKNAKDRMLGGPTAHKPTGSTVRVLGKTRNRKTKHQKKLERLNR